MSSLDSIAEDIGTIEYEQEHDDHHDADPSADVDIDVQDVQNEYDGGFTVDH